MKENSGETLGKIVNLRALAIIIVVIGHSIILYSHKWGLYSTIYNVRFLDILKDWINLIQMPLFLSISGFLFARSYKKYKFKAFVMKKAKRLLIPYVFVAVFWMYPIKRVVGYYSQNIIQYIVKDVIWGKDIGHLWFLPCLFISFVCSYFLFKLFKKDDKLHKCIKVIVFVGLYVISLIGNKFTAFPWINYLCSYYVWFYSGRLIYDYMDRITHLNRFIVIAVSMLFSALAIWLDISVVNGIATAMLLIMLYNVVGVNDNKIITSISDCSFGIYLLHSPVIYITFTYMANYNPTIVVFVNIVFALITWAITATCKKTKLEKFI